MMIHHQHALLTSRTVVTSLWLEIIANHAKPPSPLIRVFRKSPVQRRLSGIRKNYLKISEKKQQKKKVKNDQKHNTNNFVRLLFDHLLVPYQIKHQRVVNQCNKKKNQNWVKSLYFNSHY